MSALRDVMQIPNRLLGLMGLRVARTTPPPRDLYWTGAENPELRYSKVLPEACYAPWLSDGEFAKVYAIARNNTLVDIYRCFELWELAKQAAALPGDFLEVGVWRGGTACLLARAATGTNKTVYLADTFAGVVKASSADDWYRGGEHADTSVETVQELLKSVGVTNCEILTGIFPDDTGQRVRGGLSFVHIDVDVYQSAKDIFEWAAPRMQPGAVVVFDDYGFDKCPGVTRLGNEIKGRSDFLLLHNLNGHAVAVKR